MLKFLASFTNLRLERNERIARFLGIFTNLRPEGSERIARFFAIFGTNLMLERNELTVRCLIPIFTNLRPERG